MLTLKARLVMLCMSSKAYINLSWTWMRSFDKSNYIKFMLWTWIGGALYERVEQWLDDVFERQGDSVGLHHGGDGGHGDAYVLPGDARVTTVQQLQQLRTDCPEVLIWRQCLPRAVRYHLGHRLATLPIVRRHWRRRSNALQQHHI